jgi:hypothetical protein
MAYCSFHTGSNPREMPVILFPPTGAPSSAILSSHLTSPGPSACSPLSTTTFVAPSTITCKHVLTSAMLFVGVEGDKMTHKMFKQAMSNPECPKLQHILEP